MPEFDMTGFDERLAAERAAYQEYLLALKESEHPPKLEDIIAELQNNWLPGFESLRLPQPTRGRIGKERLLRELELEKTIHEIRGKIKWCIDAKERKEKWKEELKKNIERVESDMENLERSIANDQQRNRRVEQKKRELQEKRIKLKNLRETLRNI